MPKNKITDLRDHLFETLEALKDSDKPMDLDRARAVADVARVIVDSAKVEVEYLKVAADLPDAVRGTGFLPGPDVVTQVAPFVRAIPAAAGGRKGRA